MDFIDAVRKKVKDLNVVQKEVKKVVYADDKTSKATIQKYILENINKDGIAWYPIYDMQLSIPESAEANKNRIFKMFKNSDFNLSYEEYDEEPYGSDPYSPWKLYYGYIKFKLKR